ncbi:PQQ-dependent sugar dehydrogenase [Marivita sp. S2033]|uniref:PQQ-dependent sugar dehydrogenase n=1 Tax=Marivita sp. S2033 TaxID=3373187 RepID=UPI0039824043
MIRSVLVITTALAAAPLAAQTFEWGERNTDFEPASDSQFRAPLTDSGIALKHEVVADGLVHPWGIAVLGNNEGYLVTERPGRLRHIAFDGTVSEPISGTPDVLAEEQGGLLDVKLGPNFAQDRRVYLTYAKPLEDGTSATAAAYGTLSEDLTSLSDVTEIFVQTPGSTAPMHYGSRIVFNDGYAYITTGEHFTQEYREYAQDLDKTYGKIVRLTLDGEVPEDNPFVGQDGALDEIWSTGHRNIQGAMFRGDELWAIEHGPKGGDELNLIKPGLNYGWPVISYGKQYSGDPIGTGKAQQDGMEQPVYFWDPVIAPGDMTTYDGFLFNDWEDDVFIGSLVPGGIVRLAMSDGTVEAEERLLMELGRVRDVDAQEDGALVAITDKENGALVRITRDMD